MRTIAWIAVTAGLVGALAALMRKVAVVEVDGRSMSPALLPGDWLVVEALTYRWRRPHDGEVVVTRDPRDPRLELIKRARRLPDGRLHLLGDAPASSTDSREFGPVDASAVRWRACLRYWPAARFGRVPAA